MESRFERIARRFAATAGAILLGVALGPIGAGDARAAAESFTDWTADCPDGDAPCILSTTTFAEDRTWLATVRLQPVGLAEGAAQVQLLVPVQVHLASGIFVAVPGSDPAPARFIRCSARACEARLDLDAHDLDAWKRARGAAVTYRPAASGSPIRFAVSLMGLTAALGSVAQ